MGRMTPIQLATSLSKPLATCCISWTQRSHLSGPPSESESSTPLVLPRMFAGSGVDGGWWATSVVTKRVLFFYGKCKFPVRRLAVTREKAIGGQNKRVHSVVVWPDPGQARSCSTFAPNAAVWLSARTALPEGLRLSKEKAQKRPFQENAAVVSHSSFSNENFECTIGFYLTYTNSTYFLCLCQRRHNWFPLVFLCRINTYGQSDYSKIMFCLLHF